MMVMLRTGIVVTSVDEVLELLGGAGVLVEFVVVDVFVVVVLVGGTTVGGTAGGVVLT